MKTLKLGAMALLLTCLFSCTKSSETDSDTFLRTASGNSAAIDVTPVLNVVFDPAAAVAGQPMSVTATFSSTPVPDCGKLQLFLKENGTWVKKAEATLSATVHEAVFSSFVPTVAGQDVYEFKVHYVAGGCPGFNQVQTEGFFLDVAEACTGLTLQGAVASAVPAAEPGMFYFTVNYTVKTCGVQYDNLKTQGGLTAWSTDVSNVSDGGQYWAVGNSSHPNTVTKWEESLSLPGNTKTYSITFKKAWSGSEPVTLTGNWSTKATLNGVETGVAECAPLVYE
jgi:hypothetical protein